MTPQKADRKSAPVQKKPEAVSQASKKTQQILEEALQASFGLTASEASAHAALLTLGQLTPYEVSSYSGLPLDETEPALEALATKKLARVMPGVVKRYSAFPPYKKLAALVDEFRAQSSTALKELQTRQQQFGKEMPGQLANAAMQLEKGLAKNYHSQAKTLRAAATTLRTSLLNLTQAQKQSLSDFSDEITTDLSSQTAALQKSLNQSVDEGIKQLQDAYSVALKDLLKLTAANRTTSQQWLDSSKNRLLGHLEVIKSKLQEHFDNASVPLQELTENTLNATKADAAAKLEAAHQQLQQTTAALTNRAQTFGKKQRQSIDAWQKQQAQVVKQATQVLGQNQRESLNQATRALTQIRSGIDKTLDRESQRVAQDFERSTAEIVAVVEDWSEGATQIGDNLFLNLRTTVSERIQAFLQLQKEIEDTVSRWPPTALTFAQLTTLREALTKLTQGAAKESGKLVRSLEKTTGAELKQSSLSELDEEETLLESLADNLAAQQPTLIKNVEATASKAAKAIEAQSGTLLKTADASAKSLQDKLRRQGKLLQEFRQKGQQTINEEAAAVAGVLGAVGAKLQESAETHIPATNENVQRLSTSCKSRITDHGNLVGKHLTLLEATLVRYVDETNQSLQQKLQRLKDLANQYSKDVETTATRLRGEQTAEIEGTQADYRNAWQKQTALRDRQMAQTLRAPVDQLKKKQHDLLPPLQQALDETLFRHTQTALTDYRTTLTNEQATLHDHATTTFQTTLHKLIQQDLLPILTKHTTDGLQPLQDAMEQSSAAVQDIIRQADTQTAQQIEKSLENLATEIQEYASANISNLTALNAAINKALDQEFNTLAGFVSSFQDRARESLARPRQAITQEDKTLVDGVASDLAEIGEGYLSQLSEIRTLFATLSQELVSDVDKLAQSTEAMTSSADADLSAGLSDYQTAGEAFIQDLVQQTQQLVGQNQELGQKTQTLIRQQAATVAEAVGTASDQLREFVKTRIPQAKEAARQASGAYLMRINEYQTSFEKQLSGLESEIAAKCDGYVSLLQQELAQLQSVAAAMAKQIAQAGKALDTTLREGVEKSLTMYLTTIEEQGTQLHEEVSKGFQATLDSFGKIQSNLLSVLSQDIQNGKTGVEEAITLAGSNLEESIRGVSTQSETFAETLRSALASTVEESTPLTGEAFAAAHAAVSTAVDDVLKNVEKTYAGFLDQVGADFSGTAQLMNQETDELRKTITIDVAEAASTLAEASTQAKDKLDQMGRDGSRRAVDLIRSIRDTAFASLEERSRAMTAGATQVVASTTKSMSTEARQTTKQVFADLKSTQQVMKTMGQALAKESGSLLKQTSAATLSLVDSFVQNAEPALNHVETGAADLQQTLTRIWDTIAALETSRPERTWRIAGKPGVQSYLQDMIRRARSTITIVYPSLKEAPLEQLVAMPPNCRLHLITTLDRASPEENLRKLLARQNVRVWDAPKTEFYAGSRDGEEVLIAPIYGEPDEVVAVASDHSSYVALFNQSLGPHWISEAEELVQRKPPQP